MRRFILAAAVIATIAAAVLITSRGQSPALLQPVRATATVPHDPDDPAIWVHPTDPARSIVLATDKMEQRGGLHAFGLDGNRLQSIEPLDRPNNVDIEYGVMSPEGPVDIAVVTERMRHRLRVFGINHQGMPLSDLGPMGMPVLEGQSGAASEPMGIALYKRASDGAVFAIVAPKAGGPSEYLWQYRLTIGPDGPHAVLVRRFGAFSGRGPVPGEAGEIEAVAVDDELGYVYYADERYGIHKWHADPDHTDASRELAVFGLDGYEGDREGLAIYRRGNGTGYLVSSDQVPGGSRVLIYPREGRPGAPHVHPLLRTVATPADETDGLDVTAQALPEFPDGLLVMMNSGPKSFLLFSWSALAGGLPPGPAK